MKTVLILAGLIALALSSAVPQQKHGLKTTPVDTTFVDKQKKIFLLLEYVNQVNPEAEYYKIGHTYDVEAHSDDYTNKTVVETFLELYRAGFLPKTYEFSVFYDRMREEAIALFELFYHAKDFETFYKTACFARVHINEHMFLYTFYIAVVQRADTNGIVLPAPYEIYSTKFANFDVLSKINRIHMQGGIMNKEEDEKYGIIQENGQYVFFSNYSNTLSYPDDEDRIAYFTEDVGLNAYYYYFHTHLPFWWSSEKYGPFKERRGEIYYYFYQQLLARYYLERLTNGLGKIREFSWYSPIPTGYYPMLYGKHFIFSQRPNEYDLHQEKYYEDIRFLSSYEQTFFQYLQQGHFKAFDKEIDFLNPKAVNFVGNYWQTNADLYDEDVTKYFQHSYEITARHVLGGAPKPFNKYKFFPSALDFYQTSLRDPVTYQLYNRIVSYINEFKQYLPPYTQEDLHFVGVKISDVKVEKLVTYFDYFNFDASNSLYVDKKELNTFPSGYKIRQPRLNQKPFSVTIKVKSDVAVDAVFKIFLGPKYDSNGFPIPLEENWNKFFELDWFVHKIMPGQNRIVRKSSEFLFFKEDSLPISDVLKMLDSGVIPTDMSNSSDTLPQRLMLPRGTKSGFPLQMFVFVYPYQAVPKELEPFKAIVPDTKPFGYPFDRQVQPEYFRQPNMHFEDVKIYHEGEEHTYKMNIPFNEHIQLVKLEV